ncbi:MAG: rod shape-determining protein RodA [Ignavibacteria bacterium]|nr:rod shape-determining protein RodA [Ignavibacteria bacterium]
MKNKKFKIFEKFDILTLILALLITALGIISIYSATHGNTSDIDFFTKQLIFAIAGFIIVITVSYIQPRYIALTSYYIYGFAIILLVLVLLVGKTINGNKSWFYIAGYGIQPSEFAKMATILAVSFYLNKGNERKDINELPVLMKASAFVILPTLLIKLQNDTGTAIIFLAMLLPIYWGAGLSPFMLFSLITPIIVAVLAFFNPFLSYIALVLVAVSLFFFKRNLFASLIVLAVNIIAGFSVNFLFSRLEIYQQKRILAVIDPATDPLASGYNVIQSKVAIGSGGLFGKGFLQGTQTQLRFIPEQWTDFIFCMIGEEFGFIGAVLLILLYTVLIIRILYAGVTSANSYLSLITVSIGGLFLIHLLINVGMTIGIMPVIGIPLPLVSYGVSSLLTFLLMLGLVMNNYRFRTKVL